MSKLGTSVLVLALLASTGVAAAQEGGYRPEMRRCPIGQQGVD